jgi:hypothetical protein
MIAAAALEWEAPSDVQSTRTSATGITRSSIGSRKQMLNEREIAILLMTSSEGYVVVVGPILVWWLRSAKPKRRI